jgi:hypothetical protein
MTMAEWNRIGVRLGDILTALGAVVGVFGVIAMAIKLKIVLTPDMQQLLFYKILFAGAAGLLIVGAWMGRQSRAAERESLSQRRALKELEGPSEIPLDSVNNSATDRHAER